MAPKINLGTLFKDDNLEKLNTRIDNVIDDIFTKNISVQQSYNSQVNTKTLNEVLSALQQEDTSAISESNDIVKLLEKITISKDRLQRYRLYEEIYSSVQLIKRIVAVYINNILQRDIMTSKSISIKEAGDVGNNDSAVKEYKLFVKNLISHFNIEDKLSKKILPHILRYGDYFIEIIDLKEDVGGLPDATSQHSDRMITESIDLIKTRNNNANNGNIDKVLNKNVDTIFSLLFEVNTKVDNDIDVPSFDSDKYDAIYEEENKVISEKTIFSRLHFKYHKPHNIIILKTPADTILGFLEVDTISTSNSTNVAYQFAQMVKQLSTGGNNKNIENSNDQIIQLLVKRLIQGIINKSGIIKDNQEESKLKQDKKFEEQLLSSIGDEMFYMIKQLFIEINGKKHLKKFKVRYIPIERMVQFTHNPIEFEPYGTSVLDALLFPGKLYLLIQITNVIMKISRASLIRKWTVNYSRFIQ